MSSCLILKKSNCKNCYKCIRHCSVKSIRFSGNQAHIIDDDCVLCGQCYVVCPQNAKQIASEREKVRVLLQSEETVFASIAPSFVAYFQDVGIEGMTEALLKLGFAGVEETAVGATIVKKEYERLLAEEKYDLLISSSCHSVNLMIQKYYPHALMYLAPVLSPMQAHCQDIKRRYPKASTVFIGPCVAKKDEAENGGTYVDAVLTFDELSEWLNEEKIELRHGRVENEKSRARFFPTTGGILQTMEKTERGYRYLAIDGAANCMAALKDIENGKIHHCFIEMSMCEGSCISGPVMKKRHNSPISAYLSVASYAGGQDFEVEQPGQEQMVKSFEHLTRSQAMPTEEKLKEIMQQMGKTKPSDELNCGSCGYDTCREKAIAIFQGKAVSSMCLPFLKEKAESFSDNIVSNTPNGLIVLNESTEVQQINKAALSIINLRHPNDILGDYVVRILDPAPFFQVLSTGQDIRAQHVYLAEYKKHVEQTIIHDREYHLLICILRDVTQQQVEREKKDDISRQTVEIADKVVDRQMRIVQEIASLLGETAAETKIALTKLKESISDE